MLKLEAPYVHGTSNGIPQSFEFTDDFRHPVTRSFEMKSGEPFFIIIRADSGRGVFLDNHGNICESSRIDHNVWECKGQMSNSPHHVRLELDSR